MSEPAAPDVPVPTQASGGPRYAGTIVPVPVPTVIAPAAPPVPGRIRSVRVAAHVATAALGLTVIANVILLLVAALDSSPVRGTPGRAELVTGAAATQILGSVIAAIAFITWLYLAMRNIKRWGITGLTWSPVWAIAGWLIPVANLVIPPLVVNAADKGSSASVRGGIPESASTGLIWAWWLTLLFGGRLDRAASRLYPSASLVPTTSVFSVFAAIGSVIAAIAAISLVRRITTAQVNRQASLDAMATASHG